MYKYGGIVHTVEFYLKLYTKEIEYAHNSGYVVKENKNKFTLIIGSINITVVILTGWTFIKVDLMRLISCKNVLPKDNMRIIDKIYSIITPVLFCDNRNIELRLKRIDLRFDVKLNNLNEKMLILKLYEKMPKSLYRLRQIAFIKKSSIDAGVRTFYESKGNGLNINTYNCKYRPCFYYKSKNNNFANSINLYAKDDERIIKGVVPKEEEVNLLRFELQLKNRHLNYNKNVKSIEKDLENYLDFHVINKYFNKYFKKICFSGNYYNIYHARKIIEYSNETKGMKQKLVNFLNYISKTSIDRAKKKYSYYQFREFTQKLESLNINPILIPKHYNLASLKNPLYDFFNNFPFISNLIL